MTNIAALKSLCNAICSTFYPDEAALEIALFNMDIDPQAQAVPKDAEIFRTAVRLVTGYVEGSRSEGGVSASVRSEEAIRQSISIWCGFYGLEAEDVLAGCGTTIENATDLW